MKSTFYVVPVLLVILPNVLSSEEKAGLLDKLIINSPDRFFPCKLNVDELPPNQPLYVNSKTKRIILPTLRKNRTVLYTGSHTIGLAYPENGELKLSKYSCSRERLFKKGFTKHHPKRLTIEEPLPVDVLKRGEPAECTSHTIWYTPGFLVDDVPSPLMSNCYNETAHFSVAATHKIDGRVVTDEIIPWTVDTDIKGGGDEEKTQKEFYVKALKVFGEKGDIFLVPLRLVPAKDLVLSSLGTAASAFTNIVPIFPTTGPIWVLAENYIRRVAKKLQETITVYTGVSDQINIGSEGLKIGSVPIPAYIWKIVSYKNQCFVLAMANNIRTNEVKCKKQSGDNSLHEKICCSNYDDFNELNPSILPTLKNKECETVLRV